jgi:hypothetical protein
MLGTSVFREGPEIDVELGLGPELIGRLLTCTTTILDVQPATNHASVTYTFTGGARPKRWALDEELEENRGAVFQAVFTFVE